MRRIVIIALACGWLWPSAGSAQTLVEPGPRREELEESPPPLEDPRLEERARPRRPLALSIVGGSRGGEHDRSAYGMLRLSVGLDQPRRSPEAEPLLKAEEAVAPRGERWEPGGGAPDIVQSESDTLPRLARETVSAALRVAGHRKGMTRLAGLVRRSRRSAYLPELRLQVGTRNDRALRLTPTLAEPGRFTQADSRDLWFETRLNWRLDRLMYTHDELAIERLRARSRAAQQALTARVLRALQAWLRARLAGYDPAFVEDSPAAELLAVAGSAAELDVLTDGWFSRRAAQLGYDTGARSPRQSPHDSQHSAVARPATGR